MVEIFIQQIDQDSSYVQAVRELADKNASTLGFLPQQAFKEYATRKGILVALDQDGNLAGYLLYRNVQSLHQARIVHLCIDPKYRRNGITRKLFEELCLKTQALHGIGLWCRRDYAEANSVWHSLGFIPRTDKRGRGRKETTLTFWWFDHGHKTLFDYLSLQKLKICIDANIFFDLQSTKPIDRESLALKSDWLQDEIELIVTPELKYEINRNSNAQLRKKHLEKANEFTETRGGNKEFTSIYDQLKIFFPTTRNDNQESDLKQIVWSVVDKDVNFFITRDDELLKLPPEIYDKFGLQILHPVDLILWLDEWRRSEEYKHMRLAGTNINQRRIQSGEHEKLANFFQYSDKENKSAFLKYFRQFLIERDYESCYVEDSEQKPLALFVYDRSQSNELNIPLFRINKDLADKTILRFLILQFISLAAKEGRFFTKISDPYLSEIIEKTLQEDSFLRTENSWLKINPLVAESAKNIAQIMNKTLEPKPDLKRSFQLHISLLQNEGSANNTEAMIEIERILWPAKITDTDISTITIPIKTTWASRWFDEELARQTLFGAEKERAFNREGVYYSRAKGFKCALPGRILWYVTKDDRVFGASSIRACSRLDDIIVGKPKDLFRQFKHLGIYEWGDVYETAKRNIEEEIIAFRFSDTLLFKKPVSLAEWGKITLEEVGAHPPIYSPTLMPKKVFERVYKLGMELV